MKTGLRCALFIALALCSGPVVVYAGYPPTLINNRVPRENWTYDALALLAARDMVPGVSSRVFYGDWLYTRREMAGFVASAVKVLAAAPDEYKIRRPLVSRLVEEFRPELDELGLTQTEVDAALRGADDKELLTLMLRERFWVTDEEDSEGDHNTLNADSETFVWSRNSRSPMVVLGLSNERFEYRARPTDFPRLEKAFVRGSWHEWDWKAGQDYLWWGPAYSGSMILSDNAPPLTFLKFGKDFSLGRAIGRLRIDQLISEFNDQGASFWFFGRRWEKTLSEQWDIAVNETAKMSDAPNPLILIMPVYLYEHINLDDIDEEFNAFYSLDVTYSFKENSSAYLEFLIDDMTAPGFLGRGDDRPRRIGWLAGIYHPFGTKTSLRAEYILTDPGTYVSARPEYPQLSYTHDGYIIGHPVGPNSSALFLRLEQRLSTNLDGVVEYIWRDGRDPAGPNPGSETAYKALLSYGIKNRAALWLEAQQFLQPSSEDRVMLGASYTF